MKRSIILAVLGICFIGAAMLRADAGSTNGSIAVIDFDKILADSGAGKRASKEFDATRLKKQSELDAKQKALQAAAADLKKQRSVLKPEAIAKKEAELEKSLVEVQEFYVKLERDLAESRTKLIQDLLKKAGPVVKEIATKQGINMVLDRSAVVYVDGALDITSDISKRLK